jgi:hypothetical protein
MMKRPAPTLWDLSMDAFALGLEAQQVIALRMTKFAMGADLDGDEARRMVTEKAAAVMEVQFGMAQALATGDDVAAASGRAIAVYRRAVRANRRRLTRG